MPPAHSPPTPSLAVGLGETQSISKDKCAGGLGLPLRLDLGSEPTELSLGLRKDLAEARPGRRHSISAAGCGDTRTGPFPMLQEASQPRWQIPQALPWGWPATHTWFCRPGASRPKWLQSGTKKGWGLRNAGGLGPPYLIRLGPPWPPSRAPSAPWGSSCR